MAPVVLSCLDVQEVNSGNTVFMLQSNLPGWYTWVYLTGYRRPLPAKVKTGSTLFCQTSVGCFAGALCIDTPTVSKQRSHSHE